jgi:hypothetical protein
VEPKSEQHVVPLWTSHLIGLPTLKMHQSINCFWGSTTAYINQQLRGFPMERTIRLDEKKVGPQWLITSPDVPGLFVAHEDIDVARRDVEPAIAAMDRARARIASRMAVEHQVASYA